MQSQGPPVADTDHQKAITKDYGKRGGRPCIRGMRITVYDVLGYLDSGMTNQEVLAEFPYLREAAIHACLSYKETRLVEGAQ